MARLTWESIKAPEVDLRGLAHLTEQATDGFGRMATMLSDREAAMRTDATNAAIAAGMATQDPEAVKALLAQGTGGLDGRVDARAYMEALGVHQNRLMDTSLKNEEVLNAQAYASLGDEGARLLSAATTGDRKAMDQVLALAEKDPLWARVAQPFMKDASGAFDQADTRGITRARDAATDAHYKRSDATAQFSAQTGRMEASARLAEQQRIANERKLTEAGFAQGASIAGSMDPSTSPADALVKLKHTDAWKNGTPAVRAGLENGLSSTYEARVTATEEDLVRGGVTSGIPSFLTPHAGQSVTQLKQEAAVALGSGRAVLQGVENRALAAEPNLRVWRAAQSPENQKVTQPELTTYFDSVLGLGDAAQTLQNVGNRHGLAPNELKAIGEQISIDGGHWAEGGIKEKTRLFEEAAASYAAARDAGNPAKAEAALADKQRPIQNLQARIERLQAQAAQEAAGTTERLPKVSTQAEILRLTRELRAMQAPK